MRENTTIKLIEAISSGKYDEGTKKLFEAWYQEGKKLSQEARKEEVISHIKTGNITREDLEFLSSLVDVPGVTIDFSGVELKSQEPPVQVVQEEAVIEEDQPKFSGDPPTFEDPEIYQVAPVAEEPLQAPETIIPEKAETQGAGTSSSNLNTASIYSPYYQNLATNEQRGGIVLDSTIPTELESEKKPYDVSNNAEATTSNYPDSRTVTPGSTFSEAYDPTAALESAPARVLVPNPYA